MERCYICNVPKVYRMIKFSLILLIAASFFSCSSNLDFKQVSDLKLEPVVIANLASFDVAAKEFVVNGMEQNVSADLINFQVFKDQNFNDNLTKIDFFFEINNTINRSFFVNLYLLDSENNLVYSIPLIIPAYNGIKNLVTKTEIFEGNKLELLKSTSKIAFRINLLPGQTLNNASLGSLKLRSNATIYMVYK